MDSSMEIRKMSPSNVSKLVQILECNDLWKRLMAVIPKQLVKEVYTCDLPPNNRPKYRSDDFKLIENASVQLRKTCTEILLDEWGTSGRIRPCLGHLLFLLSKAQLFRAAEYIAELLNQPIPERPNVGPAALVTIPQIEIDSVESALEHIDYNTSDLNNLVQNGVRFNLEANQTIEDNLNHESVGPPVVPKIVVTEVSDEPMVVQRPRRRREISDMIKFSVTRVSESELATNDDTGRNSTENTSENNAVMPDLSDLINGDSVQNNSVDLPSFNTLLQQNVEGSKSDAVMQIEESGIPQLTELMGNQSNVTNSEDNIPQLSILNLRSENNAAEIANVDNNNASQAASHKYNEINQSIDLPNLNELLQNDSTQTGNSSSNAMPQLSILMQNTSAESNTSNDNIPRISNLIKTPQTDNSTDSNFLPEFSDLIQTSETQNDIPHLSTLMQDMPPAQITQNTEDNTPLQLSNDPPSSGSIEIPRLLQIDSGASSNNSRPSCSSPLPNLSLNTLLPHFGYAELKMVTNNFDSTPHKNSLEMENSLDESNGRFLGSGAFGSVYLALGLLGKPIAVKRLHLDELQVVKINDTITKQFRNEVEILSKYKHENLLSICGYSCDGPTYCLMYDYISGGALNYRLEKYKETLNWKQRLVIAIGTAEAVAYLHTAFARPLIHRDIKTANILLDCSNKAKLGDFGIIKLSPNQHTSVSTTIIGTTVYMAQEAFRSGEVTVKTDSFSFGVVILELLTALPPLDEDREARDLITHVDDICENDEIAPLLDMSAGTWMEGEVNVGRELFAIAKKCLEEKKKRINMVEVRELLKKIIEPN